MNIMLLLLSVIFGSAIGSFLNVVILRLPQNKKLDGRSHCPACGHVLGIFDLVPIFSYLFLAGRCRYCREKVSSRYLIIEAVCGLLFALAWLYLKPADLSGIILLFRLWFIEAILLTVFVIDLEHYVILDVVIFPAALIAALFNLSLDLILKNSLLGLSGYFASGLLGAAALAIFFYALWYFSKGHGLGFGDVKFSIFLGLALGWPQVLVGLMLAVLLGGLVSVWLLLFSEKTLKSRVPFGTFLSLGTVLAMYYGEKLLSWYLAFLGY